MEILFLAPQPFYQCQIHNGLLGRTGVTKRLRV